MAPRGHRQAFDDTPPSPHATVHPGDLPADIRQLAAMGPRMQRCSSRPISPPSSHLFEPHRHAGRWLPLPSPLPRSGRLRGRLAPVTRYRQSATGSMTTQTSARHPLLIHGLVGSSLFTSGAESREWNHRRVARQLLIFFAHEFGRSGSKSERAAPSAPQMPDTRSSPQRGTRPVAAKSPRSHPRGSRTSLSLAPRGSTPILTAKSQRTPRKCVNSFNP
jgi:hypothetical protein